MEKKKKVISPKNMPTRLGIFKWIVLYLLLDRLNAPSWLWGAFVTVITIWIISTIVIMLEEDRQDLFKND